MNKEMELPLATPDPNGDSVSTSNEDRSQLLATSLNAEFEEDDNIESTRLGKYSFFVVSASAVGGILFGFDSAIISSVLLFIKNDLGHSLSDFEKESITSVTSITALLGSVFAGYLSDTFGRRNVLIYCCITFLISGIMMSLATSVTALVLGRALVGIAIGGASMVVPVFITEIAPSKIRGSLLSLNTICTTGGQLLAYLFANMVKKMNNNWRYSFLVSIIPPILFLLIVKFVPETPRYDIMQGNLKAAHKALSKIFPYANKNQVNNKIKEIQRDLSCDSTKSFKFQLIFQKKSTLHALVVGCILMLIQQCCGFNAFMYYSPTIFSALGYQDPIFVSISIALTNFVFSLLPFLILDKLGRRRTLLCSVLILSISLLLGSIILNLNNNSNPDLNIDERITDNNRPYGIIMLVSIITYVAGYASGLGTVPWLSVEFLPLEARATGSMIITCFNWSSNFVISSTYLSLVDMLSPGIVFMGFSIISIISWLWIYCCYPEVKGIPLEHIPELFEEVNTLMVKNKKRVNLSL